MTDKNPEQADLERAIVEYAEIEMEIADLVDGRMNHVCAACGKPCCRGDVCVQAVECWFLRQVSKRVHGRWWPEDWQSRKDPFAMTDKGCLLKAGRPLICRSFVCDAYAAGYRDLWEAVFMGFVSDLLLQAGQITRSVTVESLDEDDAPAHASRLLANLAEARRQLDLARRLVDPAETELDKHRVALKLICLGPRCFRATMRRAILDRIDA